MSLWCARLTWVLLPVAAGGAISDAISGWSPAAARVAAVLLWTAWAIGLVALLAPRPWGLTTLRVVAPTGVAVAIASIAGTGAGAATLAVSSTVIAAAFALSAPVAQAAGNAEAYGDETRFPLRIPASLFLGPVPLAVALVAAGISAGPLLIAAGHAAIGVVVSALGLAVAALLARSLHALASRWLVLVPAGVVVVDPLTLVDPVLVRREHVAGLQRARMARTDNGALDLRLGTLAGTIVLTLREPQSFGRRRGRRNVEQHDATIVLVAAVRADALVDLASERRIGTF